MALLMILALVVVITVLVVRAHDADSENRDVVLRWNGEGLNVVRRSGMNPPMASRFLAILHIAMFNALNETRPVVDRPSASYNVVSVPTSALGSSGAAAINKAAHTVMIGFASASLRGDLDLLLFKEMAKINEGLAKTDGTSWGEAAANLILSQRSTDGWNGSVTVPPVVNPGDWGPTPPANLAYLLPHWGNVVPFSLTSSNQFPVAGPPLVTSPAFIAARDEVAAIGSATSVTRTADQTEIATFWANGANTETPPGHLNQMARVLSAKRSLSMQDNAHLLAQLNMALADAAIACWRNKLFFHFWRPITSIRAQTPDTTWTPLLTTPNFPEYVSGHSTFSGAAERVLAQFLETNDIGFSLPSAIPGLSRSFTSLSQASEESANSRLYGGIHYSFGNADGLALGRQIGDWVATNTLA